MNDLRSQNRTLTPVPELGPQTGQILTNPGARRTRPRTNPLFESSRPLEEHETPVDGAGVISGRPSLERPITPGQRGDDRLGIDTVEIDEAAAALAEGRTSTLGLAPGGKADAFSFPVTRELRSMPVSPTPGGNGMGSSSDSVSRSSDDHAPADVAAQAEPRRATPVKAPASRPSKRREVADEGEPEDDKFPWHHQFDHDEPQELQAKSPLLSRAFRSSVG